MHADICPICKEPIKLAHELPCMHKFCLICIRKHLFSKNFCPFCFHSPVHSSDLTDLKQEIIQSDINERLIGVKKNFITFYTKGVSKDNNLNFTSTSKTESLCLGNNITFKLKDNQNQTKIKNINGLHKELRKNITFKSFLIKDTLSNNWNRLRKKIKHIHPMPLKSSVQDIDVDKTLEIDDICEKKLINETEPSDIVNKNRKNDTICPLYLSKLEKNGINTNTTINIASNVNSSNNDLSYSNNKDETLCTFVNNKNYSTVNTIDEQIISTEHEKNDSSMDIYLSDSVSSYIDNDISCEDKNKINYNADSTNSSFGRNNLKFDDSPISSHKTNNFDGKYGSYTAIISDDKEKRICDVGFIDHSSTKVNKICLYENRNKKHKNVEKHNFSDDFSDINSHISESNFETEKNKYNKNVSIITQNYDKKQELNVLKSNNSIQKNKNYKINHEDENYLKSSKNINNFIKHDLKKSKNNNLTYKNEYLSTISDMAETHLNSKILENNQRPQNESISTKRAVVFSCMSLSRLKKECKSIGLVASSRSEMISSLREYQLFCDVESKVVNPVSKSFIKQVVNNQILLKRENKNSNISIDKIIETRNILIDKYNLKDLISKNIDKLKK
ncbi:hypothetical protein EDEG_03382 [Edhazardia aedis USNM 41457]|uniref:RING-type domain-containing protein n=1 Tax=Edhazardia aedis (strain USNM 41457) TaxID=1003232 RepID=J9D2Z4_EDHAE|nr:hypothetical protein EDEG_03382 [Edhazardia aedis USNM 41457]|eukprot:EJW02186.1 hypothetical protein EDEG_03382 [Edhazardia aedis USNM 41457]